MNKKVILCLVLAAALVYAASPATTAPTAAKTELCHGYTAPTTLLGTADTWYVWNTADNRCDACAVGCKCSEAGKCDSCVHPGWVMNSAKTWCYDPIATKTDADTGLSNCAKRCADITGKTVGCAGCASAFGLAKNACTTACPTSCAVCDVAGTVATCKTCSLGFYLKAADKTCTACPTTLTNCAQCDATGTKCVACNSSFYLVADACVACPTGATKCTAKDTPSECADGYFFTAAAGTTAASCTACGTNARLCTSATVATVCNKDASKQVKNDWVGVYLNSSGVCTDCADANAVYCTSAGPLVCKPGYSVKGTACRALVNGCATGHATEATKCATCPTGTFLSAGLCVALDTGVLAGALTAVAGDATAVAQAATCKTGWQLKGTAPTVTCQDCSSVVGCATYTTAGSTCACATCATTHISNGASPIVCLSLAAYKTGNYAVASNALVCGTGTNGATACTTNDQCADGHVGTTTSSVVTCHPCPVGCTAGCKANASNTGNVSGTAALPACSGWDEAKGYKTDGASPAGSTVCTASCASSPTSCPTGYLLLATANTVCTAVHAQCASRNTAGTECASCNPGYHLTVPNTCTQCTTVTALTTDCDRCTNATTCTRCIAGYLTTSGANKICAADANCVLRDSTASSCLVCKYGYNVAASTGTCTACADSSCTFTCPAPAGAGGPGGPGAGGPGGKTSGSILTFALSALLALLVVLF